MGERPRDELGSLLFRALDVVGRGEAPILAAHGVTMWEHVILSSLDRDGAAGQSELSARSRRDPTRLIANLDALEERGLVSREVDPADRRRRVVQLTTRGATTLAAVRADIGALEDRLLAEVPPADRAALRRALAALATG
jgi:DNA-binding MarR family transcriptional regulator